MAYNVPSYDTTRFSFGPGILYLGAPGSTPTVDVGAVKEDGATLEIERTTLEVNQGSPQSLIAQYVLKERATLKLSGIEWNFNNLSYLLGAGTTGGIGTYEETFEFGGAMTMSNRALRFVHRTPDGGTIDVQFFNAQGTGKVSINMNGKDMHEFPMEFVTLEGTTNFANQALAANKKQFKIVRTKA